MIRNRKQQFLLTNLTDKPDCLDRRKRNLQRLAFFLLVAWVLRMRRCHVPCIRTARANGAEYRRYFELLC